MDYIQTHPPVPVAEIENLIAAIESVKTPTIDGGVLSNLVRVCYECALKKNELIGLSIKDVAKKGLVGDIIKIGEDEVRLSSDAKQVLQNHIDYLKRTGYRLYPSSPLFPTKKNLRYNGRLLDNHLNLGPNIGLEKIRQSGICKHYDQLKDKGLTPQNCLSKTKEIARVEKRYTTKRHTKGILTGNVQPTGKKVSLFNKYLFKIWSVEEIIDISGDLKKIDSLEQILDDIRKDNDLKNDEIQTLETELERVNQKLKKLSLV